MEQPERPKWQRTLLKSLFFFHIFAVLVWTLPAPPNGVAVGILPPTGTDVLLKFNKDWLRPSPVQQYMLSFGVWQSWDMFAPNPSNRDVWGDAEVQFKDGTVKNWVYPRIKTMPLFKKFDKERYRKFFERANSEDYAYLWPDLCQWIARENYTDPKNPPELVRLYRHLKITPPTISFSDFLNGNHSKSPTNDGPYSNELLVEYQVEESKL
ncbi:MAG: hypothetical protein ABL949_14165 [Fimbriimonadaceae bacterium]